MNTYPLTDIEQLSEHTFRLRVNRPPNMSIKSGQCFNVGLPSIAINREYSMYSSADSEYLDFLIRSVEGGLISPSLKKLKPGDLVEIDGAYGEFCLKDPLNTNQEYLFIATGTGIAPFHSFVQTWPTINYKILHGIRTKSECYNAQDYIQGAYVPCISQPDDNSKGIRVTDYLSTETLSSNVRVYICGNRKMIIEVFEILHAKGISGDQIITEVFF
jgi:NAD(P)H-flavin reductase